ncbi:ATP-dependent Clp protease ATP-binding subunit [Candidatus Curtissbacteria bacterium]|nr:ATP-dependent Clp protease ATP-binding subunit [Candidatus Curtissbacteria bacterium]
MWENFFSWYLDAGVGQILDQAKHNLASSWRYLNIAGLIKTLFAPYRRMQVEKKTPRYGVESIFDKIVFNLISRLIGAFVRAALITTGIISLVLIATVTVFYITVWLLIPPLSIPGYLKIKTNTITEKDLESKAAFLQKLKKSSLFRHVSQFFDQEFAVLFENLDPQNFGTKAGSKIAEVLADIGKSSKNLSDYLAKKGIRQQTYINLVTTTNYIISIVPKKPLAPIGQTLSFGYTRTLEQFARRIIGQELSLTPTEKEAIEAIEKILTRPQNNNILLVGEPGVGRHATIEDLAVAIATSHLTNLSAKQLVYLDTIALAGTGKNLVEVKSNFQSVLVEARNAGNVILVIDQIDKITSAKDSRLDLSEVLTFALRESDLPIIALTTPDEFNEYLRPNAAVLKFFERIDLVEPQPEETLQILVGRALNALEKERIASDLLALVEIVARSNQLIADKKQPEKAIILFDEITALARDLGQKITVELVDTVISQKTKTPIGALTKSESEKLKNLETLLHKRIIGQNEAIEQIAKAMRRARVEIENTQKPIGSFLFLGPTGVGKTETAKALAEAYFGDEIKMVRLDMSEFQANDGLARLIGDIGSKSPGILTSQVRDHPYGILLLDEFEKASPTVHNLFLQVLDEGFLTDAFGKKVSFSNIIIIATSNAGAEFIREQLQSAQTGVTPDQAHQGSPLSERLINFILENGLFSPELINRFDGVIVYHPLTEDEVVKVTILMLKNLSDKLKEAKNITLEVTDELAARVAKTGYNPQFGARPIKRLIADKLEDEIAKLIIDGSVKNGDKIAASTLLGFIR